jgi:hypothetical protein
MNTYTVENWSKGTVIKISALGWNIENYQHTFYKDDKGKIITQSYSTRYWDITNIKYETSDN